METITSQSHTTAKRVQPQKTYRWVHHLACAGEQHEIHIEADPDHTKRSKFSYIALSVSNNQGAHQYHGAFINKDDHNTTQLLGVTFPTIYGTSILITYTTAYQLKELRYLTLTQQKLADHNYTVTGYVTLPHGSTEYGQLKYNTLPHSPPEPLSLAQVYVEFTVRHEGLPPLCLTLLAYPEGAIYPTSFTSYPQPHGDTIDAVPTLQYHACCMQQRLQAARRAEKLTAQFDMEHLQSCTVQVGPRIAISNPSHLQQPHHT